MKAYYEYIFDIEKPDKTEEQRVIEFLEYKVMKLRESNRELRAENERLKQREC